MRSSKPLRFFENEQYEQICFSRRLYCRRILTQNPGSRPNTERTRISPHPLPEVLRQMGSCDSEDVMHSPYGMELVEDGLSCKLCSEGFFCHLPKSVMEAFQPLKLTIAYPVGATLFVE